MEVPDETAKAVFDIATHSLDFGSGFLDDSEVIHLRVLAKILGVDPLEGTPLNFRAKYCTNHVLGEWQVYTTFNDKITSHRICETCGTYEWKTEMTDGSE